MASATPPLPAGGVSEALPDVLFRAKRGLCPGCGSPLPLGDREAPTVVCRFCGQDAVLERRLRRVEPEVPNAPLRLFMDAAAAEAGARGAEAPWTRSPRFRQAVVERAVCPGCGDEADFPGEAACVTCRSCGTESRWERRLSTPPPDLARDFPRPRRRGESGEHEDDEPETEQLVYRLVTEDDVPRATRLARQLQEWRHVNGTLARLLPALLGAMRTAPPGLAKGMSIAVGRLLCSGRPDLRNAALRAAERFVFAPPVPHPLVLELGLGDATGLKLLLDVAEVAARRGDLPLAGTALLGVDRIFERNYGQHGVMGEILLHRMLYLSGPVLAYAFLLAQRQRIGFFFPAETLLGFLDEAAVERPGLVAELTRCFYVGLPAGPDEYRVRRLVWGGLTSADARRAALVHYLLPPEEAPEAVYREHAALLLRLLDDDGLQGAAQEGLEKLVALPRQVPAVVHELVRERGDALPAEMRRAYLRAEPQTPHLSPSALPSFCPRPEPGLTPELERSRDEWNEAIRRTVDSEAASREAWRALVAEAGGGDEPLF